MDYRGASSLQGQLSQLRLNCFFIFGSLSLDSPCSFQLFPFDLWPFPDVHRYSDCRGWGWKCTSLDRLEIRLGKAAKCVFFQSWEGQPVSLSPGTADHTFTLKLLKVNVRGESSLPSSITRSFNAWAIGGTTVVEQTDCRTGAFNSGKLRTIGAGQKGKRLH